VLLVALVTYSYFPVQTMRQTAGLTEKNGTSEGFRYFLMLRYVKSCFVGNSGKTFVKVLPPQRTEGYPVSVGRSALHAARVELNVDQIRQVAYFCRIPAASMLYGL